MPRAGSVAVLDTCSVRALGAPYLLLPRLSRVLDNLIPCYKYIPSYRRVLMSDIRLLRAGVCVSPLDRLVRRAVGPPLPQAISISLSVFLPMADDEPPRSPRLAAAMDSLAHPPGLRPFPFVFTSTSCPRSGGAEQALRFGFSLSF